MNLGYHSSSASGNYLGRIEPIKGKSILDELAERLVSDVENMLPSQYSLKAEILNNDDVVM